MNQPYEVLREVFQITKWKDDAVYKTKSLGLRWIPPEHERDNRPRESNILFAPPPTSYNGMTIRSRPPEAPQG